jgi:hypothetical protein
MRGRGEAFMRWLGVRGPADEGTQARARVYVRRMAVIEAAFVLAWRRERRKAGLPS